LLPAGPVNFGTFHLTNSGTESQFSSPIWTRTESDGSISLISQADLTQGALRTLNQRLSGSGGAATQTLFFDTITFNQSAFQGSFGATYNLTLTATFDGFFNATGTIGTSSGVGGRIHVYSGNTVIDSSVFDDTNSLINFLFINGPTPLCANGVNGPDFQTHRGPFTFSVSCTVQVSAANPTVRFFLNLPVTVNAASATWEANMLNTARLSLGDLGGRQVTSASGVFPGTVETAVPEPGSLTLAGIGLALAVARARLTGTQLPRN
jgi:hypothetical protein